MYAQTDAAQGWRGIASFLAAGDTPGLERTQQYTMLGGHALGVTGLKLTKCPVPETDMLFGPGDGFKAAMRHAFGKPIPSFQGLQWELADVVTDLEAARLLTY